ncbi:MAG: 4'-phosphopantetheinyl transferase superfamily protein [Oscillospiraceae bacterium]|nr:4'-phosphopantetheinyl transferase superfamily protein [Oscillospiraceae bacterium]
MDIFWCELPLRAGKALPHEAGRRLLEYAWRERFGPAPLPPVKAAPGGKPRFPAGTGLHFSISHSGPIAACAFGTAEAGLDLEEIGEGHPLLEDMFAPEERLWLAGGGPERFYALFTGKESLVKLTGEGIAALRELPALLDRSGKPLPAPGGAAVLPLELWLPRCAGALSLWSPEPVSSRPVAFDALFPDRWKQV